MTIFNNIDVSAWRDKKDILSLQKQYIKRHMGQTR